LVERAEAQSYLLRLEKQPLAARKNAVREQYEGCVSTGNVDLARRVGRLLWRYGHAELRGVRRGFVDGLIADGDVDSARALVLSKLEDISAG
jgi:hypothetical protein